MSVLKSVHAARFAYFETRNPQDNRINKAEAFVNSANANHDEIETAINVGDLRRGTSGHLFIILTKS